MRIAVAVAAVMVMQALVPGLAIAANKTHAGGAGAGAAGKALHRVDFRIEGASCVVCLRRIAKTMRETKGIAKADVSIYRPYWAIAIYDAKAVDFAKVQADIGAKEKVRFMEVEDKPISEMPAFVIPKVSSAQSKAAEVKAGADAKAGAGAAAK